MLKRKESLNTKLRENSIAKIYQEGSNEIMFVGSSKMKGIK